MVRVASLLVAAFLVPASASPQQTVVMQTVPGMPASQAPARDTTAKTGTARIRGHVVAAENGAPLRRAQVRVTSGELRENRVTATDEKGAFEFKDLPAGRYTINASKGSFVSLSYGQTRPFEGGKPLEVLDGQTVEKIDFALPRGSVITGRVVDEYGEPAADVQVAPMRSQFMQGRRRLVPIGRFASTNDVGEFRLFGLPPGQYYLSATLRNFSFGDSDVRTGYAQTYYPGTTSPAEAQRIKVDLGQSISDVNIALLTERAARIAGSVADSQGRPVAMGNVMAMPRGGNGMFFGPSANAQIKPDGTFTVSGVAPGDYTLRANFGFSASGDVEYAVADVTVSGDDISGVHMTASKMVTATGRVVAQDAAAAQSLRLPIRLFTTPANPDDSTTMMGNGGGNVKDDFSFELKVPPGKFRLAAQPVPGWTLRAVRHNGIDVTDSGLEFTAGGDASGIEVELSNHVSTVSGVVANTRGDLVKDYTVMVFSQDRDQWGGNSRYRGGGRPDQDGRFEIRALPAGKYYAIALDYVDPAEAGDPELLDRVHTKATTFSINDGETKTLDLKLQTAS